MKSAAAGFYRNWMTAICFASRLRFARQHTAPTSGLGIPAQRRGHLYGLAHDVKIAFRNMRKKPSFTLMVIGMLALGVARNAAIFSVFNSLFLRHRRRSEANGAVSSRPKRDAAQARRARTRWCCASPPHPVTLMRLA
jgi:hypothetical protein